jgi:tetratricopeptide (TPR) repeat protein
MRRLNDPGGIARAGAEETIMSAEKYALLEARIRQTASLVARLRDENQLLVQENEQLCERIAELEGELQRARRPGAESTPDFDHLLEQLDTLHQADSPPTVEKVEAYEPEPATDDVPAEEPEAEEPRTEEDYFQLGTTYERRGQFESAIQIYQQLLEADDNNLEVAQRLAFLLEKLNRDEEAAPLWDRIWTMRAGRSNRQRWSR